MRAMTPTSRSLVVATVLVAGLWWPCEAGAVDGLRVRTPVVWEDAPCMSVVDRSVDPVVHLAYTIPFEDTEVTPDEVADGRRHQFFALCRDHDPTDELPSWISEADVAAAEALGLVDPGTITGDAILDLNRAWQGCALRITADDERRPITFAAAAEGVDWDTSAVEPGAWVVEGFTHDPAFSVWSPRPGVIKVVDDLAPEASGPAAAVLNDEAVVDPGEAVPIEGCVSAMEGSTLELRWAEVGEERWHTAIVDEPVRGEAFTIDLVLPPEMAGQSARVRVEAEDPQGRRTTAYMSELVIVLPAPPSCEPDGCGTTGDDEGPQDTGADESTGPGGETSGATGSMPTGSGGGSSTGPAAVDDGTGAGGCGCTQRGAPTGWWTTSPWLLVLLGARRRRA